MTQAQAIQVNQGDICVMPTLSIENPVHQAFEAAQARFAQQCLEPGHLTLIRHAKVSPRGKRRPVVVLGINHLREEADVALLCTFDGEDIDFVDPVYRSFSLGIYPTTRKPNCPDGEYALGDVDAINTTPEWEPPLGASDKAKEQWILTFPLAIRNHDVSKLRRFRCKHTPEKGPFNVDPDMELVRLREICRASHDTFLERYNTPAKLKAASETFMTGLQTLQTVKAQQRARKAMTTSGAAPMEHKYIARPAGPASFVNVERSGDLSELMENLTVQDQTQSRWSQAKPSFKPRRKWNLFGKKPFHNTPSQVSARS